MNTLIKIAAATIALAATPALAAQAQSDGKTASVSYADLDLSGKAGQDIFDRRIESAIEQVCGRIQNRPSLDASVRDCQRETMEAAKPSRDLAIANFSATRLAGSEARVIRFAVR